MNRFILFLTFFVFIFNSFAQEICVDIASADEVNYSDVSEYAVGEVFFASEGINFIRIDDDFLTSEGGDFIHWANGIAIDLSLIEFEEKIFTGTFGIGYELIVEIDGEEYFSINSVNQIEDSLIVFDSGNNLRIQNIGAEFKITVEGSFNMLNIISGSGGIYTACVVGVVANGLNELDIKDKFIIYPNPVSEEVFIDGIEKNEQVILFDVSGKVVLEQMVANNQAIKVNHLNEGMYFIKVGNAWHPFLKK